eukprot:gene10478-12390_t
MPIFKNINALKFKPSHPLFAKATDLGPGGKPKENISLNFCDEHLDPIAIKLRVQAYHQLGVPESGTTVYPQSFLRRNHPHSTQIEKLESKLTSEIPSRVMIEDVDNGINVWYRARVLREEKMRVEVGYDGWSSEDNEWIDRSSTRIWRGGGERSSKLWRYIGDGAWEPISEAFIVHFQNCQKLALEPDPKSPLFPQGLAVKHVGVQWNELRPKVAHSKEQLLSERVQRLFEESNQARMRRRALHNPEVQVKNKKIIEPITFSSSQAQRFQRNVSTSAIRKALQGHIGNIRIGNILDPKHPVRQLVGQTAPAYGVFVTAMTPPWTVLGEYTGAVKLESEIEDADPHTQLHSFYFELPQEDLEGNDEAMIIDATKVKNELAYINAPDNPATPSAAGEVRRKQNTEFVGVSQGSRRHILAITTCCLTPGSEVLAGYGETYWENFKAMQKNYHCKSSCDADDSVDDSQQATGS